MARDPGWWRLLTVALMLGAVTALLMLVIFNAAH